MKLVNAMLRWYKSFHLNYRGQGDKGEASAYRPWNTALSPPSSSAEVFPFIEIPVEHDITTIVGANESGKSHLLSAISKVVTGTGVEGESFVRTDLCHYAGIRSRNVEAWPNIGLQFTLGDKDDFQRLDAAMGGQLAPSDGAIPKSFAIILAPNDESTVAYLFVEPTDQPWPLDARQLEAIRKQLPSVQFIDSKAQLASELPLAHLISAYPDGGSAGVGMRDRRAVESVADLMLSFTPPGVQQPFSADQAKTFSEMQTKLSSYRRPSSRAYTLELLLFKDILDINLHTLQYIHSLTTEDRSYTEGQIAKWNEEIIDRLNISHFWRQDEQFALSVAYKDGIIYFEIRDKTDSIYTFKDRSSGLKFFLSYYLQAKAMEMTSRNRNSIILMDEPDAALSIIGQRNLLAVFESLVSPEASSETCQLIYTTHSPYLVNRNFPRRIRVVKKEDSEEGTQYIEEARARRYEPVRTALGIDNAPSLFLGSDNVLLEGSTDQYLLAEAVRVFATPATVGDFIDLNAVALVSADGAYNVENVLEQSHWADEPIPPTVVMLDSDAAGRETKDKIVRSPNRKGLIDGQFVALIGDLVGLDPATTAAIEDIVPPAIYAEAVGHYAKRWLPETYREHADEIDSLAIQPDYGKDGLVTATGALFARIRPQFGDDYDKMSVLQEVMAVVKVRKSRNNDDPEVAILRKKVIMICDFLRDGLTKSRAATAKLSATSAIKRLVHDFGRWHKANVQITALQRLFRRIEREIAPIGTDAEPLAQLVSAYLAELERLRTAGQTRVEEEEWSRWSQRLTQMKKNPLSLAGAATGQEA